MTVDSAGQFDDLVIGDECFPWSSDRDAIYILPGLIDSHVHLGEDPHPRHIEKRTREGFFPILERNLETALYSGVTTLRDVGSLGVSVKQFESWRSHKTLGGTVFPRVVSAGSFLTKHRGHGANGTFNVAARLISSMEDARHWIRFMCGEGIHFVKIMNDPMVFDADELRSIVDMCHQMGLTVGVHAFRDDSALAAIESGADCIEHSSNYSDPVIDEFVRRGTFVCTTFVAALDAVSCPSRCAVDVFDPTCTHGIFSEWFLSTCYGLPRLWEKGAKMTLGTDAGCPGTDFDSIWREIFALHALGIPMERCVIGATETAADLAGLGHNLGRIDRGCFADIVLFDRNPLRGRTVPSAIYVAGKRVLSKADSGRRSH